jgi:diguanylate cyclase (GGDEF)-like protein
MSATAKPNRLPLALLANDQEWSTRSLETVLEPGGYAVLHAHTGLQALSLARSANPDVIILDLRMPDLDGTDVCRQLRDDPHLSASTPIIITTSEQVTRDQRLAALRAGAWDLFTQPLDGEALLLKLGSFLDARRETMQVVEDGLLDPISGLYNVRGLARRARELGAEAQRRRQPLACVAFSVQLLDDAGAASEPGGAVVTELAGELGELCRRAGRASDAFGRMGPLQFAVIATATTADGAVHLIERIRSRVEGKQLAANDGRSLRVRAGYHAVPDFSASTLDADEILDHAATALTQTGGDVVVKAFDD